MKREDGVLDIETHLGERGKYRDGAGITVKPYDKISGALRTSIWRQCPGLTGVALAPRTWRLGLGALSPLTHTGHNRGVGSAQGALRLSPSSTEG